MQLVRLLFLLTIILVTVHRVEKSNRAEAEEAGSGQKWLNAILISCALLSIGATGAIIYMFVEFTGCSTNNAFISLTLIFCILLTTAQMTGDEGSLLSSACISAWAAFLCYLVHGCYEKSRRHLQSTPRRTQSTQHCDWSGNDAHESLLDGMVLHGRRQTDVQHYG